MSDAPKMTWYEKIVATVNAMGEEFGLDDQAHKKLRDTVVEIAKSQFKLGNKSGIRWAYMKQSKPVAAAA